VANPNIDRMKKHLLIAIALVLTGLGAAQAQTALFIYNDGNGLPDSGTYTPGSSFTFNISLAFTSGGSITNLDGLSYWLRQSMPSIAPFPFSVTLRDVTGSMFTDLQTPGLTYPQSLNPVNANDLGAAIPVGMPPGSEAVGNGTYFIAAITVSIPLDAPTTGTFVLSNTTSGPKTSVISDSFGNTFAIPETDYTITMIPEPATWLTPILGVVALLVTQRQRVLRRL
jgi:hypothetical protein